jgi:thioester reductase-like protein
MNILLTGSTGFLGGEIARQLVDQVNILYVLIRPGSVATNFKSLLDHPKVQILYGDITLPKPFEDEERARAVALDCDVIIHSAAYYNLFGNSSQNFLTNVVGTQNLLFFATACPKLRAFHFISTIAVAGNLKGEFKEDELDVSQICENPYAATKFESEYHVRRAKLDAIKRIYRPGVVIGHSQTGEISKRDGPYYFFDFLEKLKANIPIIAKMRYLPLPFSPKALLPLIPVDHCARAIVDEVLRPHKKEEALRCYHLFSKDSPKLESFVQDSLQFAELEQLKPLALPISYKKQFSKIKILDRVGLPTQLLDYMYAKATFDQTQAFEDLPSLKDSHYEIYKKQFMSSKGHE